MQASGEIKEFAFDYSYWSHDGYIEETYKGEFLRPQPGSRYADQNKVFADLVIHINFSNQICREMKFQIMRLKVLMLVFSLMDKQAPENHILLSVMAKIKVLYLGLAKKFSEELMKEKKTLQTELDTKLSCQ